MRNQTIDAQSSDAKLGQRAEPIQRSKTWRYFGLLALAFLLVCVGGSYLAYLFHVDLHKWQTFFDSKKPFFVAIHWMFIVGAWVFWPALVRWGVQRKWVRPDEVEEVLAGPVRIKIIGFLVVFELLIVMQVQNIIYLKLFGH